MSQFVGRLEGAGEGAGERSGGPGTLTGRAYELLRGDIVAGVLPPGSKLKIEVLRERYGIGASPLREALNRLCAEELVLQPEQRGFEVAPVSLSDLEELTQTRCWLNEIAFRESIERGDEAWEEEVVLAYHWLSRLAVPRPDAPADEIARWEVRHRRFHAALIAACPSRWLRAFSEMLFDRADRYRNLAGSTRGAPERDIAGEHRQLMEAVIGRDTARAVALMDEHIRATTRAIMGARAS